MPKPSHVGGFGLFFSVSNKLIIDWLIGGSMDNKKARFSFCLAVCVTVMAGTIGKESCAALLTAVLVHECGHVAAIYLCGMKVLAVRPELSGLKIIYSQTGDCRAELIAALAGPLAGAVYCFIVRNGGGMWGLSAQLSLLYTLFNMLPVKKLDGGRALYLIVENFFGEAEAADLVGLFSSLVCALFLGFGIVYFVKGEGGGMFAAGIWLVMLHKGN